MRSSVDIVSLRLDGGVEIDLLRSGEEFVGLGGIQIGGTALRNSARPMVVRFDTPTGILYTRLTIDGIEQSDAGVQVKLRAHGIPWGKGEYCDEYDQVIVWPELPAEPAEDVLILLLKPEHLELGGREWHGFSYAFHFLSDQQRIHRLWTQGTWEIGGRITGNTVLHQGQCNMPVYRGALETLFTTTCLKTLDQYGSPQGISYQLAPRGGLLQGFDFQHADAGALFMYWPRFTSISSLLESPAGSDVLHIIDEYRFPLGSDVTTTPKTVLFTPGALAEHEARNLWWEAYEFVYGGIKASFGVEQTIVLPEAGLKYSTRVAGGGLRMTVAGEEVDSTEVPYAIADCVLPLLARKGIRRFFPEVMSESDVTVLGMKRKLDDGVHGDLHCSSVCATHRFLPAEFWGGMKAWRYMAEKARALGIEIGAWFAPHFSPRAAIFQEHPEYRVTGINTLATGGGYGTQTIVTADWNTGVYDWVLGDITRWATEGGLDYLFTDSWANLGLVQVNFKEEMRANFEALGRLYADFQKLGIMVFTFEGISPFGASRIGVADLRGDLLDAMGGVVGQNDFGWWINEEDMAFGLCLCPHPRKRTPDELERIQFRLMASRSYGMMENQYGMDYALPEWWVRLNEIYLQAVPHMQRRCLLPNRAGVCWEDGDTQIIWTFRDLPVSAEPDCRIAQLQRDGAVEIPHGERVTLPAWQVYKISSVPVSA